MSNCPAGVDEKQLTDDIRNAVITDKANACPIICRLAWHASGTFKKDCAGNECQGGSDGSTMRFAPESDDPANAGLSIPRDMLEPIYQKYQAEGKNLSRADLWTFAGAKVIEFMGGPSVPFKFGRSDGSSGCPVPPNGRLPDANQREDFGKAVAHLRELFCERMGFTEQELVALSGAHTLGRCHRVRSGFDGPWTRNPLKFDNDYFKLLVEYSWVVKTGSEPLQYRPAPLGAKLEAGKPEPPEPEEVKGLMMLPTDVALLHDESLKAYVEEYAKDEHRFFADFSKAFAKLISLGTQCVAENPAPPVRADQSEQKSDFRPPADDAAKFREAAMHGSLDVVKEYAAKLSAAQQNAAEDGSNRTALHKAAYWGHVETVAFLATIVDVNAKDSAGDTALHDAARFAHSGVIDALLKAGADKSIKNNDGQTAADVAQESVKPQLA